MNGKRVFLSYVHDDAERVNRLDERLRAAGILTWKDERDLPPGRRWKQQIRTAIRDGGAFIACFSERSEQREASFMRIELVEAINELALRQRDRSWFFPVKFSECAIPDIEIGAGETLRDIQWVDLFPDFELGFQRLAREIGHILSIEVVDEIDGWRRFNWITSGPPTEAKVAHDQAGWVIAAPERTYNGLYGVVSTLHCRSSLSLEFMLESPKQTSAGYGIGIAPRGRLAQGAPTGWFLEVGWHGNVRQFRFRGAELPDGPWQSNGGDDHLLKPMIR